jgi:hypothetical protein
VRPLDEYAAVNAIVTHASKARERTHIHLGNAKVAIFIAAVIYTVYALRSNPSPAVFAGGAALFIALSIWHEAVIRALARAQAAVTYYADGIARIEDRWMRETPSGERFRDPLRRFAASRDRSQSSYADDLDVFGRPACSSCCRRAARRWGRSGSLAGCSSVDDPRHPRASIARRGVASRIDLRERIAVVNAGRRQSIHAERLIAWAEARSSPAAASDGGRGAGARVRPGALCLLERRTGNLRGDRAGDQPRAAWLARQARECDRRELSSSTESAALDLLANVVKEIEVESFDDPALVAMARRLKGDASVAAASTGIARLARISDWADSRHNAFLKLSEIPILFTLQLAYAAESWRHDHGSKLRDWVDAVGEMEALLSLAGYSYEHPSYPFPELLESPQPILEATEVAHPLLPATAVSNSLDLQVAPQASRSQAPSLIVSGSNMSGKSTLMRTVGINVVLALAGAPVRAGKLRLTPLAIGTCLRHTDSLQEHRSGFYTEALRIRAICDLLDGPLPVLFLFDELLSGTNSKDRRVAAEGVIRTMISRGAIGMVTTHDLALTETAAIFRGQVKNVHLQDKVENGQMSFDYKLRDGVITHSNALELMRMIGLDV